MRNADSPPSMPCRRLTRVDGFVPVLAALLAIGCDTPHTYVVLENHYPVGAAMPRVVYRAFWQSVSFPSPVVPGGSSDALNAIPASANTAYVVLAPGWDPSSATPPTSFVVMQSREGLALQLNDTLHIAVDDATFAGNCQVGSTLTQDQADLITQRVFAADFAGWHYDAATCTATPVAMTDAGAIE